jgi:hypothetical protein
MVSKRGQQADHALRDELTRLDERLVLGKLGPGGGVQAAAKLAQAPLPIRAQQRLSRQAERM